MLYAAIFTIVSQAYWQGNTLVIEEPETPSHVRTLVESQCEKSKVIIEYRNQINGLSLVEKIQVGQTVLKKKELDPLNRIIGKRDIEYIHVMYCEYKFDDTIPVIYMRIPHAPLDNRAIPEVIGVRVVNGKLILDY